MRYFLCFSSYSAGDFSTPRCWAVVSPSYPDSGGARQCAKIAMASYLKMFAEAKDDSKPPIEAWSRTRLGQGWKVVGRGSAGRYGGPKARSPNPTSTATASSIKTNCCESLTRFEGRSHRRNRDVHHEQMARSDGSSGSLENSDRLHDFGKPVGQSPGVSNKIPEDSSQRGTAELKMGQAFSGDLPARHAPDPRTGACGRRHGPRRIRRVRQQIAARQRGTKRDPDRAEKTLVDGVARMEKAGRSTRSWRPPCLSLAQIFVDTEQAAKGGRTT